MLKHKKQETENWFYLKNDINNLMTKLLKLHFVRFNFGLKFLFIEISANNISCQTAAPMIPPCSQLLF